MQISSYQHSQSTSSYQHFYPKEVILQLISLKQYGIQFIQNFPPNRNVH